jgi:hypothetical protein
VAIRRKPLAPPIGGLAFIGAQLKGHRCGVRATLRIEAQRLLTARARWQRHASAGRKRRVAASRPKRAQATLDDDTGRIVGNFTSNAPR